MLRDMLVSKNGLNYPHRYFTNFFDDAFQTDYVRSTWPPVDIHEFSDKFVLRADLPGVDEKHLKIELHDGELSIEGTRKAPKEEGNTGTVLLNERLEANFKRAFKLGEGVQADQIQAEYQNGVLTVTIPKSEKVLPRVIPIKSRN